MWEITLRGKPSDIVYFLELKNSLKEILNKNAIIVITFEKDLVCSIAIAKEKLSSKIYKKIYETILKIVKIEYITENIKVFSNDKSLNSYFVSSIVNMEISNEVKYAMQVTKLSRVINIRPFVLFKLHNLYEMWQKEVDYYNFHFNCDNRENYLDFLKFIALNIDTKSKILYLEEINSEMCFLDEKRNKMKNLRLDDEVGIIANLVMYAPKKLIINCINSLSDKVTKLISYIFEDRVSVLL